MKMIFLPGDTGLQSILETLSYKNIWKQYRSKLLAEFTAITGLSFQQKQITARVHPSKDGESGNGLRAMTLPGNCRTHNAKCIVLTHELGHRLLSGNVLHGVRFGFSEPRWGKPQDDEDELEHRLLYLFLSDVLQSVFGDDLYRQNDLLETADQGTPHAKAYSWAMGMTAKSRRRVLYSITSDALVREEWDSYDPQQIKYIGVDSYRRKLDFLKEKAIAEDINEQKPKTYFSTETDI